MSFGRCSPKEAAAIQSAVLSILDDQCEEIYLFGSRTDLNSKGGDWDIGVILKDTVSVDPKTTRRIKLALRDKLGDQKIDLLMTHRHESDPGKRLFLDSIASRKLILWAQKP